MDKLNIRQFKLLNGEEIIALVSRKEKSGAFIVERPFLIRANMIGGFMFLPWFPFSSQKMFKIASENVLHHVEIDEDIKTEYIRLAASSLKPKLNMRSDAEMLDDLTDFINETYNEFDVEEDTQSYEGNVIPFPSDPKKTIH